MVERKEISAQEVAFYRVALAQSTTWLTAKEYASLAGIAPRSGRAYALKFVRLGLLDLAELWPSHRYRWSLMAAKRNRAYLQRLEQASAIFTT